MVEDIRSFLDRFNREELIRLKILLPIAGSGYLLKAQSVAPLVQLMKTHNITRLEKLDANWFLTSEFEFENPRSKEHRSGDARTLKNRGNVFNQQNPSINPYFEKRTTKYDFQDQGANHYRGAGTRQIIDSSYDIKRQSPDVDPYPRESDDVNRGGSEDIGSFLERFSLQELIRLKILVSFGGAGYLLRAQSVGPLVNLMKAHNIEKLEKVEANWFLTSEYEFQNPGSQEHRIGDATTLKNPGNVFNAQNPNINPYFKKRRTANRDEIDNGLSKAITVPGVDSIDIENESHLRPEGNAEEIVSTFTRSSQISELIQRGESERLEYKSTFQWDVKLGKQNTELRDPSLKTLVAFMNSDGGTLLIGVDDSGGIFGIEEDIRISKNSEDQFLQLVNNLIADRIGPQVFPLITVQIDPIGEKKICRINVSKSAEPSYLTVANKKVFFIRAGNTSRDLDSEQTVAYIRTRFGGV